jgi:hypothetical protein
MCSNKLEIDQIDPICRMQLAARAHALCIIGLSSYCLSVPLAVLHVSTLCKWAGPTWRMELGCRRTERLTGRNEAVNKR